MKTKVVLLLSILCALVWHFGFSSSCFSPKFSERQIEGCEGYWTEDNVPSASVTPWCGKEEFLNKLKKIEKLADGGESNQFSVKTQRGLTNSRIDGSFLGNKEYHSSSGICWTGDFSSHYVDEHNIVPSKSFYNFITSLSA